MKLIILRFVSTASNKIECLKHILITTDTCSCWLWIMSILVLTSNKNKNKFKLNARMQLKVPTAQTFSSLKKTEKQIHILRKEAFTIDQFSLPIIHSLFRLKFSHLLSSFPLLSATHSNTKKPHIFSSTQAIRECRKNIFCDVFPPLHSVNLRASLRIQVCFGWSQKCWKVKKKSNGTNWLVFFGVFRALFGGNTNNLIDNCIHLRQLQDMCLRTLESCQL